MGIGNKLSRNQSCKELFFIRALVSWHYFFYFQYQDDNDNDESQQNQKYEA